MKATVTADVETMWGGKLAAGTEIEIEPTAYGLYEIVKPEKWKDCYIGPEEIEFKEEEQS